MLFRVIRRCQPFPFSRPARTQQETIPFLFFERKRHPFSLEIDFFFSFFNDRGCLGEDGCCLRSYTLSTHLLLPEQLTAMVVQMWLRLAGKRNENEVGQNNKERRIRPSSILRHFKELTKLKENESEVIKERFSTERGGWWRLRCDEV